jgi:hypothetical protein
MADESLEKSAEIINEKQEKTDDSVEEKSEIQKEISENISESNNDSKNQDLETENAAENEGIDEESQRTPVDNVPKKTGFLRSFLEKKKVVQSPDVLEDSEESNG